MKKKLLLSICLLASVWAFAQPPGSVSVQFAFNRYELTAAARATLDSLTDSLDIADHIELHGHCDAVGSDAYNIRLSTRRVKAVEQYLLGNGWEKKEITVVQAYGERRPLNDNATETDRSLNRRVEIRILRGQKQVTLKQKLSDSTLKTGDNIILPNIHFVGGMHQFLPSSAPALLELLEAMQTYPKLVIRVEGHICCQPDHRDGLDLETGNNNLSEERSRAVMNYLIQNGIDAGRISNKGFGHSRPLHPYPEQTEQQMMENRRVEIKIVGK